MSFLSVFFSLLCRCTVLDANDPGNLVPRTVDEDPSLPRLSVNGTVLHLQTFGNPSNPPVVFLHGGPGGNYGYFLRDTILADDFFVIMFDQRGSGLSRRHPQNSYSMDVLIDDLQAIINYFSSNDTSKVNLVGHSWGAMYAAEYLSRYPNRVNKVVLSDPGPFNDSLMDAMPPDLSGDLRTPWINDLMWNSDFLTADDHIRLDYIAQQAHAASVYYSDPDDPYPNWRWGAAMMYGIQQSATDSKGKMHYNFVHGVSAFKNKVLFIRSGNNKVHTHEYVLTEMRFFPSAELKEIPNVDHYMPWEKSKEYTSLIREYFIDTGAVQ